MIREHLKERVSKDVTAVKVKAAKEKLKYVNKAYANGLKGEKASAANAIELAANAVDALELEGKGREIDLLAILMESKPDGYPAWTVADPRAAIGRENGGLDNGTLRVGSCGLPRFSKYDGKFATPSGFPPLPPEVRKIFKLKLLAKARWAGVLFKPDSWTDYDPSPDTDPAVVVEWKSLPGRYFALAIWGEEAGHIEEFLK